MRYPQTVIDDLKQQADIVRVIQDYVPLKKKGQNWLACCPFHKEDTPSFSVSPSKEIFYCFGCQKGGNVFSFVMDFEHVSFPEAIKLIANKVGFKLPAPDPRSELREEQASSLYELNELALQWWVAQMQTREGELAKAYLSGRGISNETIQTFQIGFAPNSWEGLVNFFHSKGVDQELLQSSGLVVTKEGGGFYDRWRGRLMIPILDLQKRPIAFNGRTLIGDQAKYINSPETPVYVKGRNLFGLHLSRDEIRKKGFCILVEGAFDLIIPYQYGIRNIAASLGTSFTPHQAETLSRYAGRVVINYDGDAAGIAAAKKALESLLERDMEVKVLVLPDSDPDEFIRMKGVAEYRRVRTEAKTHMQFVIDLAIQSRNMNRPRDKADAVEEVLPFIKAINNRVQKREYFDIAMNQLRITEDSLKAELWNSLKQPGPLGKVKLKSTTPGLAEKRLLEILINDQNVRANLCPELASHDLSGLHSYDIFRAIIALHNAGLDPDFDTLNQLLSDDPDLADMLPQLLFADLSADPLYEARSCLDAIWLLSNQTQLDDIRKQMTDADSRGDTSTRDQLAQSHLELVRRRNQTMKNRIVRRGSSA